jgi:hypothetical protein
VQVLELTGGFAMACTVASGNAPNRLPGLWLQSRVCARLQPVHAADVEVKVQK